MILGRLCPLMNPVPNLDNVYERVKVRIDGDIANVTVPITPQDPINRRFFVFLGEHRIRFAEVK